jgi:PHD/YefM family antitoxin component YafN of YafNO toxin-antitoxin module
MNRSSLGSDPTETEDGFRRVNTRTFRTTLAQEITSDNTPTVITRHGKDVAALISINDFKTLNLLKRIGVLEQLKEDKNMRNSLGIIKKCIDEYIISTRDAYIKDVIMYLKRKIEIKMKDGGIESNLTDRSIEKLAAYIMQNWRTKDESIQIFTDETIDDIVDNQISSGILQSILESPRYD